MATIDEKAMNGADLKRFAALIKKTASQSAHGMMSKTDKAKLDGIAAGAEVNVQADWNQTTTTADDYIKNKPTIDSALSSSSTNAVQNKVVKAALDTKVNTSDLASVTEDSEGADLVGYGTKTDGGTTTNVSVKDALDEIYESIGDGGDLATRVTALESGKQDKDFIVTITKSNNTWSQDKTFNEIKTAYLAGKTIVANVMPDGATNDYIPLIHVYAYNVGQPTDFVFQGSNELSIHDYRVLITSSELHVEDITFQRSLTFDNVPTENSNNPVKSGGVYTALQDKQDSDFIITVTAAEQNGGYTNITKDHTLAEIQGAYAAGKRLIVKLMTSGNFPEYLPLLITDTSLGEDQADHFYFGVVDTALVAKVICIESQEDGGWKMQLQETLTFDNAPTANSTNPVKSGGIYTALQGKQDKLTQGTNITISNNTISALDEKVNQTASTENADIPMLLANGATPSNGGTKYDADLKYNPSTNTLKLGTATLTATNYSGNAATATNATNDGSGNNIANTYALKTDVMNPHPTIVTTLPTADGTHHGFYFVKDTSSTRENVYTEYIEVQENSTWKWEPIGSTDVTLDVAYLTTSEVETIWNDTSWT